MGDKGGSTTTVQQAPAAPPSLYPESREGFNMAQSFFKNVLQNPPQYQGQRLAPVTPGQVAATQQTLDYFGRPQPLQTGAENQLAGTIGGQYLGGPASQAAVSSLASPLFRQFTGEVLPGLRDRAQLAGQGVSSSRRQVGESRAVNEFGEALSRGAIAPIYEGERNRQLQATQMAPGAMTAEASRLAQLRSAGEYERGINQNYLDVGRQMYEEPLFRQGEAASALGGLAGFSPGGSVSQQKTSTQTSTADQALGAASTALLAASVASKYGNK